MSSVAQIIRRRKRRSERRAERRSQRQIWIGAVVVILGLLVVLPAGAAVGGTAWLYWSAASGLPAPQDTVFAISGQTLLYDRDGVTQIMTVQDPLGDQRQWISLDQLSTQLIQATLVWEDPDFLTTTRFDLPGTVVRLWNGAINGTNTPDPTLTGRLVRNTLLNQHDPLQEIALVAEINRLYTPESVLEWHLNTNYYGNHAYGIEAAAQVYLGKSARDLTLDEAALLAAIPLAPQYNPFDNEPAARGRQGDVLRVMLREGYITDAQYEEAATRITPIQVSTRYVPSVAPDYSLYARDQAEDILDSLGYDGAQLVARGGLKITTALDLDLYYQSECALRAHLNRLEGQSAQINALNSQPCTSIAYLPSVDSANIDQPPNQGAVAIIDPKTGELRAMVGSASVARYQPGPTLRPFVYFNAFVRGQYTPATMVLDIPQPFPGAQEGLIYTPTNPDSRFRGPMNLRDAMGAGLLPPAAAVAYSRGIDNILRDAHKIGLNTLDLGMYDLMLLERDGAVSVLDIAYSYSVFASLGTMNGVSAVPVGNGYRVRDPVAVLKIEDANGEVLWEYQTALNYTIVFEPDLGYLLTDILADQRTRWSVMGENNVLDLPRPSAVINGLTGDRVDNWTVGYTPDYVIAVHLGRQDDAPLTLDAYGLTGAAPVWRALMEYTHNRDRLPASNWQRPDTIVQVAVCERSGLLPNGVCPTRNEIFINGMQERLGRDTYWQIFQINSQNGQRATANTPSQLRSDRVYFIPPDEAADWWQANGQPLPPTEYDTVSLPELFGSATILRPEPFSRISGVIDVRGSLNTENMVDYQLSYGRGLDPVEWIEIGAAQTEFTAGGSLGSWDTNGLDGLYTLQLAVTMADRSIDRQFVLVTVDNIPPQVTLKAGEPGQIYRWPGDIIVLEADVEDNLQRSRAEFYHNGEFMGTDSEWPFGFEWETTGVGLHTFSVTAFDSVGNSTTAEITVEVVRRTG